MSGLPNGMRVKISGLTGAVELNGREATVVGKEDNTGRITVDVDGAGQKNLKPDNLAPDLSKGITLVGNSKCPFAQRAWLALEESGLNYTRCECELDPKPQWLLDINPLGKVPVLVEDGKPLVESAAIVDAIVAKAREKIPGRDEVLEKRWRTIMDQEFSPAYLSGNKSQMQAALKKLNLLLTGPFLTGTSLSAADILAGPTLQRVFDDAAWTWPGDLSKLQAWWTAIFEREAFQKTTLPPGSYWTAPPASLLNRRFDDVEESTGGREVIMEVPQILNQEQVVEVPQLQVVDIIKQQLRPTMQRVPKHVQKPVYEICEVLVPMPQITVKEKVVEVPVPEYVEIVKQVPVEVLEQVEKHVAKPVVELVERIVEVPHIEVQEQIIEVPQLEVREVVKQVPKIEVKYIDKKVCKPVFEYIEKIVEVPQIVYEEQIVEVPEVEIRKILRKVPKPIVKYVDKQIPKAVMQVVEKIVPYPVTVQEEVSVEVLVPLTVELTTQRPVPQYQEIPKEIPKVQIQVTQQMVEVPTVVQIEQPVEVPEVQTVEVVTQVLVPTVQIREKQVPTFSTQVVEKVLEVPHFQIEEVEEVLQIQTAEVLRQDAVAQPKEVVKQIPRVNMQYRERVTEMKEQIHEEFVQPVIEFVQPAPAVVEYVQPAAYVQPAPAVVECMHPAAYVQPAPAVVEHLQPNDYLCQRENLPPVPKVNICSLPSSSVSPAEMSSVNFPQLGNEPVALTVELPPARMYQEPPVSGLQELYQSGQFTDVVLVCGKQRFPAHRVALACHSSVFQEILQAIQASEETLQMVKIPIEIPNPDAVKLMLDYLYGLDDEDWGKEEEWSKPIKYADGNFWKAIRKYLRRLEVGEDVIRTHTGETMTMDHASGLADDELQSLFPITVKVKDAQLVLALRNYENFYKLPKGRATEEQVRKSSAGIEGWAYNNLEAIYHDVLSLARRFQLPGLTERATSWLAKDLTTGNMFERLSICNEFGLNELFEKIVEQLTCNRRAFAEIAYSSQIKEYPNLILAMLQSAVGAPEQSAPGAPEPE